MKIIGIILLIVIITIVRVLLGLSSFHEITEYNNLSSFSSQSSLSSSSSSSSPVSTTKAAAVMIVESKNNSNNNNNRKTEEIAAAADEAAVSSSSISSPATTSATNTSTSTTSVSASSSSSSSSSSSTTTTAVTTGGVATTTTTTTTIDRGVAGVSYRTPLAYGTKSGKDQSKTAYNVEKAIQIGFRHIVTCGHHSSNNESGVGLGLQNAYNNKNKKNKNSVAGSIERKDLFLQTCFVPFTGNKHDFLRQSSDPPEQELLTMSIEDQVHLSIKTSLRNLKTTYIDAYIFHNFRAKLYDTNEMLKAWTVFEDYVDQGIIKQLGITSVHNAKWFEKTFFSTNNNNNNNNNSTTTQMIPRIKPTIIQNRFHSNRQYDVGELQEIFHGTTTSSNNNTTTNNKYSKLQIQRFWILNGSSGGGRFHTELATKKGLSAAQLMLSFVMTQNETCLVGTNNLQHMRDDIVISKCYNTIFTSEQERNDYSKKLGMKQQPVGKQLPGSYNGGGGGSGSSSDNPGSGSCYATTE
jgi:diketogulonate reductase-like aldo/keto reductase